MANPLQGKVIRDRLSRIGKTAVDVARELDVPVATVRGVMDGRIKGDRGAAHRVAVALGIKDGVIISDDMSISEAMKVAAAA